MGCKNCIGKNNDIVISNSNERNPKSISELDLIDKIIEKRNILLNLEPISTLEREPCKDKFRNEFMKDTNNEEKLCQYLNELRNSNQKEYELNLFLYFDILSPENKKKYSNENFKSNIDKFEDMIVQIKNNNFPKENYSSKLEYRIILIEKNIIKIFPKITNLIKDKKNIQNNKIQEFNNNEFENLENQIKNEIDNILNKRILSKISLSNIEILFQELIDIYIEKFSKKKGIKLRLIQNNVSIIYKIIIDSIEQIKKNKNISHQYSSDEEKYYLLVFIAPIIGDNLIYVYNFSQLRNLVLEDENFEFIKEDNKLTVKYKGNNKLNFPDYNAINQNAIIDKFKKDYELGLIIDDFSIINCIKPNYFQKYNFYNYKIEIKKFNNDLLNYILKSKTIKTLLGHLMPELKNVNIFNDDKTLREIEESIIFVPYKLDEEYGVTLKSFLKIFINGLPPAFPEKEILLNSSSSFQITGIHEICGHWICAYLSYKLNDNSFFKSICYKNYEVKEFDKEIEQFKLQKSDGGEIIEKLLFSRVMEYTTIKEMLFILCKFSYDNDYITFKNKFKEINKKDIKTLYDEVIKDSDLKIYLDFIGIDLEYLISLEESDFSLKFERNGDIKNTCTTRYLNSYLYN